ncbi:GNAT family N-acetyltransferase [Oceanobacillus profundus]|uniref:GNAT family N-acetyltransferase n=1 Tax=Oceanobacillus profundus TaxID=372463 RepID=A0A417YHF5_9BACI|nr:GNAT family N-acetyltransferase [Oceanobacillus profundus]RHW32307.1 GNAT family N-acetyltransferase [Oceanobacillus profundus]
MPLHIREVTTENWRSVAALSVSEQQNQFIESNAFSLAESQFEKNGISFGLYDVETLVGYAMYGWYSYSTESAWLDRFMIDYRFQGNGYAKRFLPLLIQHITSRYGCRKIYLSLHPDNKPAQNLYESFGFCLNGEIDDSGPVFGVVMQLDMDKFNLK